MPRGTLTAIFAASALALAACPAIATAQDVPNLVGTWTGSIVGGARFGDLTHDPDEGMPVFADRTAQWRLTIDKQDGSGLIGTWARETKTEALVGVIRQDNVTVLFADEDN